MTQVTTATDRLQRLLALVPYVVSRKAVGLADTAEAFGLSEQQLVDDLNMLWCVELRSPDPYCPIDLSYEGGEIVVGQAESMERPLRLAADEASALLVALRMLADVPGLSDRSALSRTIAKLEAAAGTAAAAADHVAVQVEERGGEALRAGLSDALARRRRLHLSYYVPGRDEATERDVDPMRLLVVDGRTYLEGWCRSAGDVRLFRLDRILGLTVLDVAAARRRTRPSSATWIPAACSSHRKRTSGWRWSWPRPGAGWPSTTRARRSPTSARAGCGSACAPPTPSGYGGWRCGSGRTGGSPVRRSWPTGSGPTRRRRSRSMADQEVD